MLGLDIYRMPFRLLLPDENGMYRTFLGTVLSILTLVMIITFGGFKTSQLVGMLDYKVQTHEMLEYFEATDKFGYQDGFSIAAGIFGLSYDGIEFNTDDPTVG